jgi:hypothetical protein
VIRLDPRGTTRQGHLCHAVVAGRRIGTSLQLSFTRPVGPSVCSGRVRVVPRLTTIVSQRGCLEPRHGSHCEEVPVAVGPRHNRI